MAIIGAISLPSLEVVLCTFVANHVSETKKLTWADMNIGVPQMMIHVEMAILSIFHVWAYWPFKTSVRGCFPGRKQYKIWHQSWPDTFRTVVAVFYPE